MVFIYDRDYPWEAEPDLNNKMSFSKINKSIHEKNGSS